MILVYNLNLSAAYNGQTQKLHLLPKIHKIDIASPQLQYLGIFQFQIQEVVGLYLHVTRRTELYLSRLHVYFLTYFSV